MNLPPIQSFEQFAQETHAFIVPPFVSKLRAVPWRDLEKPGPEHEWLIKGTMTRGEVVMMAGSSGSGKTFLGLDVAGAVLTGLPWFGNRVIKGGVIYQAGEGRLGLKKRIRAYRKEKGLLLEDDWPFVLLPSAINLHNGEDDTNKLIQECSHWAMEFALAGTRLELLVIDTLSAATPGIDENSSKDNGPVLERCQRIAEALKCTVLLIHHMNAEASKIRGWSGITANLDCLLVVRKTEVMDADRRIIREVEQHKVKDGEAGRKYRFVLPAVELGVDQDNDAITSCVVRPPNDGERGENDRADIDEGLSLSPQAENFVKAICDALDEHGKDAPFELKLPPGTKVVEWHKVAEIFDKLSFEDEPDPTKRGNKRRLAMKRHGEYLMSRRIIMRQTPYIWLTGRKVKGMPKTGKKKRRDQDEARLNAGLAMTDEVRNFEGDF